MEKQLKQLASEIIQAEEIISNPKSLDKSIQQAKQKIENIMSTLTFVEMLALDEYIMQQTEI